MDLPGFRLHPLKGQLKGFWSMNLTRANWAGDFFALTTAREDVDYVDYH